MGKLHFMLFQSLLLLSSHLDDIWKLMLYLGMFLDVHEGSYKLFLTLILLLILLKLTEGH